MSLKTRVAQTVQTLFSTITAMLGCVSMGVKTDLPSSFDDGSQTRAIAHSAKKWDQVKQYNISRPDPSKVKIVVFVLNLEYGRILLFRVTILRRFGKKN